ncbi:hypothetical protein LAZ67_2002741, partial [Cordylochernes scorpioides]
MYTFRFEGTVTGINYLTMLADSIFPAIRALYGNDDFYFQLDGAPPHYHRDVRAYLDQNLSGQWIGRRGPIEFPARSPDLTPLDFFLWGTVKDGVYKQHWIFQQDSAPAHKVKSTQQCLETNVPEFIKANEWPSGSPDLNPLGYSLWAYLEEKVCYKRYHNLDKLNSALVRAMKEIPLEKVRATIDQWPERLRSCVKNKGEHFEC